jgi:hypothetical protein
MWNLTGLFMDQPVTVVLEAGHNQTSLQSHCHLIPQLQIIELDEQEFLDRMQLDVLDTVKGFW